MTECVWQQTPNYLHKRRARCGLLGAMYTPDSHVGDNHMSGWVLLLRCEAVKATIWSHSISVVLERVWTRASVV